MALIGKILAWILRNILTIAVITVVLCLLAPGIRVAKENASKLTEQREAVLSSIQSVEDEIVKTKQSLESRLSMLDHWRQQRRECLAQLDDLPSVWAHPIDHWSEYARLTAEQKRLELQIETLEAAIAKYKDTLAQLDKNRELLLFQLESVTRSLTESVSNEWNANGLKILLFTICFVLFTPPLWLVFMYYVSAAIVEKFPPIRIRAKPSVPVCSMIERIPLWPPHDPLPRIRSLPTARSISSWITSRPSGPISSRRISEITASPLKFIYVSGFCRNSALPA